MTEQVSFPGLGLTFDVNRVAFSIGSFPIYWYGILIALGLVLGIIYTLRRTKTFGVDPDRFLDLVIIGGIFSIIFARLYYVAFSWDEYQGNFLNVFNVRLGGLAIYGGIIGALIGAVIGCKIRRVKILPALDTAAGGFLIGQALGRWGNFLNIEAFGSNTTSVFGMTSPSISAYLEANSEKLSAIGVAVDPSMPVHPTFLYESVWCILGFILIALYTKHRRFDGEISLIYVGWYGLGRFFIEGLRTDSLMLGSIRVSQVLAALCVIVSVVLLIAIRTRIRRESDDNFMKPYAQTEEGQMVIAGTFYQQFDKKKKKGADVSEPDVIDDEEIALGQAGSPDDALSEPDIPAEEADMDIQDVADPDIPEKPEDSTQDAAEGRMTEEGEEKPDGTAN